MNIRDGVALVRCGCGHVQNVDLSGLVSVYLEEFGEYENINVACPVCNAIEVFNMNIPLNDTDEPFSTGDIPLEEECQRHYVRVMQRLLREDLITPH